MPLLRVRAAAAESQPLSQNRSRRLLSTDVMTTLTLFLVVLLNSAASQDVRPTPGIPDLTSRANASLSFVFLTLPAASRPTRSQSSQSQSGSSEHTGVPEFREMPGGTRSRLTVSVCCLAGAVRESARSPVQVATASRCPSAATPSPFHLSSVICARFHGSPLRASILSAGDVHL